VCVLGCKTLQHGRGKATFQKNLLLPSSLPGGVKFPWNVGKVPHEVHVSHCSDSLKFHSPHVLQVCSFFMSRTIQVHLPQLSPYGTSLSWPSYLSCPVLFLLCKNERFMWMTLPSARYRRLNLLFSPMNFGIEFLYKNFWTSKSFMKTGAVTVILYSNELIIFSIPTDPSGRAV